MAEGKVAEACDAFDQSEKLEPATTTLLNLAGCREKNGQIATAWGLFVDAERQTRTATDDATSALHTVALDRSQKLESRISKLTINVSDESKIDGLEILRDDKPVESGSWNRTLPTDGGTYKITAKAPGASEWTTSVTVAPEGDVKTVDIPKLQVLAVPKTPEVQTPVPAAPEPAPRSKVLPLAVGGGAVALLGASLGFELWAESTYDKTKTEPDPDKQDTLWHSANTKRYVAEGLAVAGLAGAGVAVWLYFRAPSAETRTAVVPVTTTNQTGVALVGRF